MRQTHTYSILQVSQSTYNEIRDKLKTAAYDHAFHEDGIIDMHGIAIQLDTLGKVSCNRPHNPDNTIIATGVLGK